MIGSWHTVLTGFYADFVANCTILICRLNVCCTENHVNACSDAVYCSSHRISCKYSQTNMFHAGWFCGGLNTNGTHVVDWSTGDERLLLSVAMLTKWKDRKSIRPAELKTTVFHLNVCQSKATLKVWNISNRDDDGDP